MMHFGNDDKRTVYVCSTLTITTRHADAVVGSRMSYSHNGQLASKTPFPRQVRSVYLFICALYTVSQKNCAKLLLS